MYIKMRYTYKYLEDSWTDGYWNFIQSNLDKDLDWIALSSNPNITPDIIKNNPDKPWNQYHISLNQSQDDKINSEKKDIGWGNQIRSYVMQPYQMVKDLRTGEEISDVEKVLDGKLDSFIFYKLKKKKK